jgi:uncharacterized protein (DUF433 family)/transposase
VTVSVVNLLDREVYLYSEVDHLVGLRSGTARRWINGYAREGRTYAPILRREPKPTEWVTWGEFVEARILAEFRDQKQVKTAHMRAAVEQLRERFALDYPLATLRPYLDAELGDIEIDTSELGSDDGCVIVRTGQLVLRDGLAVMEGAALAQDEVTGERFAEQLSDVEFPGIVINPGRLGGQPTFEGRRVSVATVAAMMENGQNVDDVASAYGLSIAQVRSAVGYATRHRLAA